MAALDELTAAEARVAALRASIGTTLRMRRQALGLGVRQLARIAHVDGSKLSKVERGLCRKVPRKFVTRVDTTLVALESVLRSPDARDGHR